MASNTAPSFMKLPFELREKIWLSTFEPRTLSLNMREYEVPQDGCGIPCLIRTFDIQLGLHVDQLTEEEAIEKHSLLPQLTYMDKGLFSNGDRIKPPPGPVALDICQESRDIALKHYELMFPSRVCFRDRSKALDAAFDASGWGDAHTWVNPKIDLLFLSRLTQHTTTRYRPIDIWMLWCHCKLEHFKLERVGVMSTANTLNSLLCIQKCTALKELVIYLTQCKGGQIPLEFEDDIKGWDEEAASKHFTEKLQQKRDEYNVELTKPDIIPYEIPWTQAIPRILISQEIHLYQGQDRERKLRLAPLTKWSPFLFQSP